MDLPTGQRRPSLAASKGKMPIQPSNRDPVGDTPTSWSVPGSHRNQNFLQNVHTEANKPIKTSGTQQINPTVTKHPGYSAHGVPLTHQYKNSSGQSGVTSAAASAGAGEPRILGERTVETEMRIPRLRVTEETIEKLVVIPETIRHEEIVEETKRVRQRIIEVEKPVIQQRVVEVPEIEYIEKVVEVPQTILKEHVREVPRIELQENIIYKPKIIIHETIEEVPEVEIVEIPVEKIVEVPEYREQVVIKEVPVNRFVECPVPEFVEVMVEQEVHRNVPVPVQCNTRVDYEVPSIEVEYQKVPLPIYAPRFVEVPVPIEQMDHETFVSARHLLHEVSVLAAHQFPSLCEVESLGASAKTFNPCIITDMEIISQAWKRAALDALYGRRNEVGMDRLSSNIVTNEPSGPKLRPVESTHPSPPKLFLTRRNSHNAANISFSREAVGELTSTLLPTSPIKSSQPPLSNGPTRRQIRSQSIPSSNSSPPPRRYVSVPGSSRK